MGREARVSRAVLRNRLHDHFYASRVARTWGRQYITPENKDARVFEPGGLVVMVDRIYGVLKTGQLFRLPVRVATNVQIVPDVAE